MTMCPGQDCRGEEPVCNQVMNKVHVSTISVFRYDC